MQEVCRAMRDHLDDSNLVDATSSALWSLSFSGKREDTSPLQLRAVWVHGIRLQITKGGFGVAPFWPSNSTVCQVATHGDLVY